MAQMTPDETLALLTQLSQRPGVQSTLVLSRANGAIIRSSGLLSNSGSEDLSSIPPSSSGDGAELLSNDAGRQPKGIHDAEHVALLAFNFVATAGSMAEDLEQGDEVKLLRLRTKKHELVIVPESSFLLVVIHDTPPA
ncbi:MAG: hypothetical protein M1820_002975 [Bogoriella megaspora]|nr:MAG: hypothetical protein M1820_002975 [Bogoriella megaspora]